MAVRIADTLKQQNDLKTFPVAYAEGIWLKVKDEGTEADYKELQQAYDDGDLGGGGSTTASWDADTSTLTLKGIKIG